MGNTSTNTKYKIQIQIRNTMYARLPAQHYCTFHKYVHKYKTQNTKYKYEIRCMPDYPHNITAPSTNTSTNTKYKIQNTKYARLPAPSTNTSTNTKYKTQNTNTKYKVPALIPLL